MYQATYKTVALQYSFHHSVSNCQSEFTFSKLSNLSCLPANLQQNMNFYLFFFFIIVAGCAAQDNGEEFLKRHLPGKWKEDQYKRKNLNNYLYEMGKLS